MMILLRQPADATPPDDVSVVLARPTPAYARAGTGTDYFCDIPMEQLPQLERPGRQVVRLNDGWYEAGAGGIAIWGNGRHAELRDTPFTVEKRVEPAR